MNGIVLLEKIHCLKPNLPVVIFTSDDSLDTTLLAMRMGARGYLLKPVVPGLILQCIEKVLQLEYPSAPGLHLGQSSGPASHKVKRRVKRVVEQSEVESGD